jgi:hypothetical protein
VLPYDESLAARLSVRRAGRLLGVVPGTDGGILLAVSGLDPAVLEPVIERARELVSPDVRLEATLISASEPGAALLRLVRDRPNAVLAVPLGVKGETPWFAEAVSAVIASRTCPMYAFYMDEGLLKEMKKETHDRYSLDRLVGAVLRSGARLRLGLRSLVRRDANDL